MAKNNGLKYADKDDAIIIKMRTEKNASFKEIGEAIGRTAFSVESRAVRLRREGKMDPETSIHPKRKQTSALLNSIDWERVLAWMAKTGKNKLQARNKFAPSVAHGTFYSRLSRHDPGRKSVNTIKLDDYMPVSKHKQLKPMCGQWAS